MAGLKEPELQPAVRSPGTTTIIKTILLHVQSDESLDSRLENALALARSHSAHLRCLHVTPTQAYVAFDGFGGVFVMSDVIKMLDEEEERLRSKIEARLGREDVSWDYERVTGTTVSELVGKAALSDLLVVGRSPHPHDFAGPAIGLLGDLVGKARTALFIPPDRGELFDPLAPAVIAWDGSYEAANAVRASLGMLQLASSVSVVRVEEKGEKFPSTLLLEYLSRHGIHADYSIEAAGPDTRDPSVVAGILTAKARNLGGYLVMGGYGHSRLGEYVFGGVTRTLLAGCAVPLIVSG